jgi:hypothetical protein
MKQAQRQKLYEEQLRVSALNDANIAETRKLAFRGEVPALTAQEDASAEQLQADEGMQMQSAINNLLTIFKLPEAQKIVSSLTQDQVVGLNSGWSNIKAGFEAQFTTPNLRTVGSFLPYFTKHQSVLSEVTTKQVVDKMKSLIPSAKEMDEYITWARTNLSRQDLADLNASQFMDYRRNIPTETDYNKIAKKTVKRQEEILQMIPAECQIKTEFETAVSSSKADGNAIGVIALMDGIPPLAITAMGDISAEATKGNGLKIGRGIIVEPEPKWCHFGTFIINKNKLADNILQIKYVSGASAFPPQKISDALCEWILNFLEHGKPSKSLYSPVPIEEKLLIERVLNKAKVWDKMKGMGWKPTKDVSEDEDERRFEILKGIRGAGNDNPKLREELKGLLLKFHKQGRISKTKLGEILYDLA